jgi:SAM-dependent methyltransferase/ribosomal protein S18 acetylase RimI-like enzyme
VNKISHLGRRVVAVARYTGMRGLWFAVLGELGYRRVAIRECILDEPFPENGPRIPVALELLDDTQIDEYNAFRRVVDPDSARRRLAVGDKCFVARHGRSIVSTLWASTGRAQCEYLSRSIPIADDEAYMYDAFTAPEWRGLGVHPALTSEMHRYYRTAGKRRSICFTGPENMPAMTAKTGYRRIGIIGYVGIRTIRHHFRRMDRGELAPWKDDRRASAWDSSIQTIDRQGYYLDDFLADLKRDAYLTLIDRWGGVPSNGRVLKTDLFEEAMGPDAFLLELAAPRGLVIGMDVSMEATARAQQRDRKRHAQYLRADARYLPFADGSLALIVSPSTLDHFAKSSDLGESLRELWRVLAPEGRLIITLDNRQNVFDSLLRFANLLGMVPFFLGRSYTVKELRRELDAAGFNVLETTAIVHHPRMTAVGAVSVARRLGWGPFTRLVQSTLLSMQRLQSTRLQYLSGCFVAALAAPRASQNAREPAGAAFQNTSV